MTTKLERITLSLPSDAIKFADEIAREKRTSRSKVISSYLRELADKRLLEQMEEGYKALAKENRHFANEAITIAHEVLPEW